MQFRAAPEVAVGRHYQQGEQKRMLLCIKLRILIYKRRCQTINYFDIYKQEFDHRLSTCLAPEMFVHMLSRPPNIVHSSKVLFECVSHRETP